MPKQEQPQSLIFETLPNKNWVFFAKRNKNKNVVDLFSLDEPIE